MTARDVIALAMPARPKYWIDSHSGKLCTEMPSMDELRGEADRVIAALLSAPDSVRLELAAMLNHVAADRDGAEEWNDNRYQSPVVDVSQNAILGTLRQ